MNARLLIVVCTMFLGVNAWAGDVSIDVPDTSISVGATFDVAVSITSPFDTSGFSYGLCDPDGAFAIVADGVVPGAAFGEAGFAPDFFAPAIDPDPGEVGEHTVGCVYNFAGMFSLVAGTREVSVATMTEVLGMPTECGSGGGHPLAFCDTLGTPIVITTIVDTNGAGTAPAFGDGCVSVTEGGGFKFIAPTATIFSAVTIDLAIADVDDLGIQAQGFSFDLSIGAAVALTASAPTGVLAATNGGVGPDFFGANNDPIGGPGFTTGVVVSFQGADTLTVGPGDGSAVVALDLDPVGMPGEKADLVWTDTLGDPLVINVVVVSGTGQFPSFCDGCIEIGVEPPFLRGDCNDDGIVNIADAVNIINEFVTGNGPVLGDCLEACDANDDDLGPDISDATYIVNYRFLEGPPPPAPFPDCGPAGDIDCNNYVNCP